MSNGSTDYKWGAVETQITDMKEGLGELKLANKEQHHAIIEQLREVQKDMGHIKDRLKPLEVKMGFIGAIAGIGGAVATLAVKALL